MFYFVLKVYCYDVLILRMSNFKFLPHFRNLSVHKQKNGNINVDIVITKKIVIIKATMFAHKYNK